ncbi:hypothetical protein DOS73_08605, partial [Staphylococcus felis]
KRNYSGKDVTDMVNVVIFSFKFLINQSFFIPHLSLRISFFFVFYFFLFFFLFYYFFFIYFFIFYT